MADAVTFPWGSKFLFGIDKVTKYHMDVPLYVTAFAWLVNKNIYESMSAAQKKAIDDHCTTDWALRVAGPWADYERDRRHEAGGRRGPRGLQARPRAARRVAQGGGAAGKGVGRQRAQGRQRPGRGLGRAQGVARQVQGGSSERGRRDRVARRRRRRVHLAAAAVMQGKSCRASEPGWGNARATQPHGSLHRRHRADRRDLHRHRRRRRVHHRHAALLRHRHPRQLRLRPAAARHPDLLGHRAPPPTAARTSPSIWSGPTSARAGSAPSTCSPRWCCCSSWRCRPTRCSTRWSSTYQRQHLAPSTCACRPGRSSPSPGSATSRPCC